MNVDFDWLANAFAADRYICGPEVLMPVYLALRLEKPLLVEGAPGVGKTEIAKVLARVLGLELIRLQCYEGLDEPRALYEWNYQRQLLRIQVGQTAAAPAPEGLPAELFSEDYLLARPLLQAIRSEERPVLLIDEVDKVDEAFEAFLFELLSDFQVSVPELGTLAARQVPVVVLTSNSERDLSDGLKRRCVYLFIDFPTPEQETAIIRAKAPEVSMDLARQIAEAIAHLRRGDDVRKKPSIAETLDWARALAGLGVAELTADLVWETAGLVLKSQADHEALRRELATGGLARMVNGGDAQR